MFFLVFYLAGLLAGGVAAWLGHAATLGGAAETLLRYFLLVGVGVPLLMAAAGHIIQSDEAAKRLGWPSGSPFQKEVGYWDLAAGVVAIVAFWRGPDFWLAAVLVNAVFWALAGVLHIQHVVQHHNLNGNNAVPAVVNLLVAITLVGFYVLTVLR